MLVLREVPLPAPAAGEVLIQVQATTVSAADRRIRAMDFPRGLGLLGRAMLGFRRPRRPILGVEAAGVVVAAGVDVTRLREGDAVIAYPGIRFGAHAEYLLLPERGLAALRPPGMSIDTAAALSFGGLTALDYLRRAALKTGERLLVIGASGTVGSALVQLGAALGAEVTAVTSGPNTALVAGLGANRVIDYRTQPPDALAEVFDVVADAVGALDFTRAQPLLDGRGRFLAINGGVADMLARAKAGRTCIAGPAAERQDDLDALQDLYAAGRYRPLIDSIVPFGALPAAHVRVDSGRKRGSVVVHVADHCTLNSSSNADRAADRDTFSSAR